MKIPNMKYAPIFSEDVYQDLLKDKEQNRKKILNTLHSLIDKIIKGNFSGSHYEYGVLFLIGLKGAELAIDTYDFKERFINHATFVINAKIKNHLREKQFPTLTKDFDNRILSLLEQLGITESYQNAGMYYVKYYLETAKKSHRDILMYHYGFYHKPYSNERISTLLNVDIKIIVIVINKFETAIKREFNLIVDEIKETNQTEQSNNSKNESDNPTKFNETNQETKKRRKENKIFYDRVKKYVSSEEEMWEIFNTLNKDYQNALIQMYGPNLDEYHEVSKEVQKKVSNIVQNKYKKRKKISKKTNKTFYDRVKKYVSSEEEMWEIFNSLPEKHKKTIKALYGEDLKTYNPNASKKIKQRVSYLIYENFNKKRKIQEIHTFYDRVKKYVSSEDEMWYIFNNLSSDNRKYLIEQCGENLASYNPNVSDETRIKVNKIVHYYFSRKKSLLLPIYIILSKYSVNEINDAILMLSSEEKKKLYMRFGYNLVNPVIVPLPDEIITEVDTVIIPKIENLIISNKTQSPIVINDDMVKELAQIFSILKVKDSFKTEELIITLLRLYTIDQKHKNINLSKLLDKPQEEIDEITRRVLNEYSEGLTDIYSKFANIVFNSAHKTAEPYQISFNPIGDKDE